MNYLRTILLALLAIGFSSTLLSCQQGSDGPQPEPEHVHENEPAQEQPLSPNRMAMANVGQTHVHIEYSAPSVRERIIWGGLVPYDQVWVTGAHMATSVEFNHDMIIAGEPVPAGKYALFTIPGRESWTLILNENWDQHLANNYDSELDLLRVEITPETNEFTEQLTFTVMGTAEGNGFIDFAWEEIHLRIPISEAVETP